MPFLQVNKRQLPIWGSLAQGVMYSKGVQNQLNVEHRVQGSICDVKAAYVGVD